MVKKVIRFIVLIIGLSLVAYSGYHLFKIYSDYNTSDKTYEKLQDEYAVDDSKKDDDSTKGSEAQSPWYDDIDIDFAGLRSENPDVVGWIYFENEDISYPVMYSGDNSYYLRKTFKREHATAGSIFLEGSNKTDFSDCHTIIYGHNMKNGTMFAQLLKYKEQDFFEKYPYFSIYTPDGKESKYQIFVAGVVEDTAVNYQFAFQSDEEFLNYIETIKGTSLYTPNVEINAASQIVTLSTCTNVADEERFVVQAVKVSEQ